MLSNPIQLCAQRIILSINIQVKKKKKAHEHLENIHLRLGAGGKCLKELHPCLTLSNHPWFDVDI